MNANLALSLLGIYKRSKHSSGSSGEGPFSDRVSRRPRIVGRRVSGRVKIFFKSFTFPSLYKGSLLDGL